MVSSDDDSGSTEEVTMNQAGKGSGTMGKVKAKKAKATSAKKKRRHKPKDFPKRPLSAYNIFFKETREAILAENEGKSEIAFQTMAKEIASRWKNLNPEDKQRVSSLAEKDMKRYREEVKTYEEEMVKRSRKEREEAENLRRIQAAEKAEEEASSSAAALTKGPSTVNSIAALGATSLNSASLEQQLANGGTEIDALRREQIQMKLLEELRTIEARAMQIRQLQAQLGLPTTDNSNANLAAGASSALGGVYSAFGGAGGNGNSVGGSSTLGGAGSAFSGALGGANGHASLASTYGANATGPSSLASALGGGLGASSLASALGGSTGGLGSSLNSGSSAGGPPAAPTPSDIMGRQTNPMISSLVSGARDSTMNDYEMLLRHRAGAGLGLAPAGAAGLGGLLGLTGAAGLGGLGRLGGLGTAGIGGGPAAAMGNAGTGGLNMGLLGQLQGLGGLQQALGMPRDQGGQGPDLQALLQQSQQELFNRLNSTPSGNP